MLHEDKKLHISKNKCQEINQKNRDLRVQIKSLLKDQVGASINGKLEKNGNTKRELVKQKNYLIEQNDALLFTFKKLFIF